MPTRLRFSLPVLAVLMAACGAQQPTATPTTPSPTVPSQAIVSGTPTVSSVVPTATQAAPPTATSVRLQTQIPTETPVRPALPLYNGIPHGVTSEGFFFLGNPDAPITLTDYSDFL